MAGAGTSETHRTGHEMKIGRDGSIFQSAIRCRHTTQQQNMWSTGGAMVRAVVMAIHYVDEEAPVSKIPGEETEIRRNLLCDVMTYGRVARMMYCVPLLQRIQGLWDEDTYIPRATRSTIDGRTLSTSVPYTAPELMDGDHVILGFLENDPAQPVILPFTLGHPGTQNAARLQQAAVPEYGSGQPPRNRRIRHGGTLIEINEVGDIRIDATGAAKAAFDKGEEVPNNGSSGTILIKTKDGDGGIPKLELNRLGNAMIQDGPQTEFLLLKKSTSLAQLVAAQTVSIEAPVVKVGTAAQTAQVCGATNAMVLGSSFMISLDVFLKGLTTWLNALKTPLFDVAVSGVTDTLIGVITGFQSAEPALLSTKAKLG